MSKVDRQFKTILVTGGCGFIGSNFIRYLLEKTDFEGRILNLDCLTYAGNPLNLSDIDQLYGDNRYFFEQVDICDASEVERCFNQYAADAVVHFAAESHVDRSIEGPGAFIQTNIIGTYNLLQAAAGHWQGRDSCLFHHVSTDEVYGSLGESGYFYEQTAYDPRSPYSASKASSDHLVRSWAHTFDLPVTLSNCSNNYGAYQFPEKLIPVMILNILEGKPLPVYGDGKNIRDWLYVDDHCSGIWSIMQRGRVGETYNIGGENEWTNIDLVNRLCEIVAAKNGLSNQHYKGLINFVKDRPGHDRRYAINCDKIRNELDWSQSVSFTEGLEMTVSWYLNNLDWVKSVQSGEYRRWMDLNYAGR